MNPKTFAVIHFEPNGQAFQRWEVAKDGAVLASHPDESDTWARYRVTNLPDLVPGATVTISNGGSSSAIAARVARVETPFNHYAVRRGR